MIKLAAVLTGDLVGSTRADPAQVERTMTVLEEHAALIGKATQADTRFTRFRGDGWQIILQNPQNFLWVAVYFKALLRGGAPTLLANRIAIGLGTADSLGSVGLSAAKGKAFTNSGRALDAMVSAGQVIALAGEGTDDMQRCVMAFLAERISGWSPEQAQAVRLKLAPGTSPTQGEMAAHLGITRQAIGARLQAAGYPLIENACLVFRAHDFTKDAT